MKEKFEMANEKINDLVEEHPMGILAGCSVLGFALVMPLCAFFYRWLGKTAGKEAAKTLIDAGVHLGYTHD